MTKLQGVILGVIIMLLGIFGAGLMFDSFQQGSALRVSSIVFGFFTAIVGLVTLINALISDF